MIETIKEPTASSHEATQTLCKLYWEPIYSFIRFRGYKQEESEDLTQAFFAMALDSDLLQRSDSTRGRLRSFLLKVLGDFLNNQYKFEHTQRRGGTWQRIPFEDLESQLEGLSFGPEAAQEAFDYQWALGIVRLTAVALRSDYENSGKIDTFNCLQGFLPGAINPPSYAEAAAELGVTEGGVRTAIFRLRSRFRQLVRMEIQKTLHSSDDIDEELDYLIALLSRCHHYHI